MQHKGQIVTIETRTVVRVLLLITAFVFAVSVIAHLQRELIWIGVAFFLAVALDPAVHAISKLLHSGRLLATSIVFIIFVALLSFLGASLVPPLISQTEALAKQIPHYLQDAQNNHGYVGKLVQQYHLVDRAKQLEPKLLSSVTTGTGTAFGVIKSIFSGLTALFTILVLTFFMLLEGPRWVKEGWRYVPLVEQKHYHRLVGKMYDIVSNYMTGSLIIAGFCAAVTAILLAITGVPFAIPLGIVAGLSTLIPIIGIFMGFLVVFSVALFTSPTAAITMFAFFVLYGLMDGHVLKPIIYGRTIELSPLLVIVAIVLGTSLAGAIGALVAIPVAACIAALLKDVTSGYEVQPEVAVPAAKSKR